MSAYQTKAAQIISYIKAFWTPEEKPFATLDKTEQQAVTFMRLHGVLSYLLHHGSLVRICGEPEVENKPPSGVIVKLNDGSAVWYSPRAERACIVLHYEAQYG